MARRASAGSHHRPFLHWEILDDEALDKPIHPLVAALNATGWVRTVFSCAGHPEEPDSIVKGRRQAHVDVVTCDPRRWKRYARQCKEQMPVRIYVVRENNVGPRHLSVRVREGSLGEVPPWLRPHLPPVPAHTTDKHEALPWWRRLVKRRRDEQPFQGWHYRRLVFEPFEYRAPAAAIRIVLDHALRVAGEALEDLTPFPPPTPWAPGGGRGE